MYKLYRPQEWATAIVFDGNHHDKKSSTSTVNVLRLSEFVLSTVAKRRLPQEPANKPWTRPPTVVMKLDIEG